MATAEHVIKLDPYFITVHTMQAMFQQRLLAGDLPHQLGATEKAAYVREQALALTVEVGEALNEIGWKSWAKPRPTNRPAYVEELADVFIFFMNMMLVEDVRPTELLNAVKDKIAVNIKRQDKGYVIDHTTKCPGCKRSYNGAGVLCARVAPINANGKRKDRWCMDHGHIEVPEDRCPGCNATYGPDVKCTPETPVDDDTMRAPWCVTAGWQSPPPGIKKTVRTSDEMLG